VSGDKEAKWQKVGGLSGCNGVCRQRSKRIRVAEFVRRQDDRCRFDECQFTFVHAETGNATRGEEWLEGLIRIDDLIFPYDGLADGRLARGKSGSTNSQTGRLSGWRKR
jgi:hypothetical protein